MAKPPVNREASARGGRARTAAKLNAVANARAQRRDKSNQRHAALEVPSPFRDIHDFLAILAELSGKRMGGRADLASACSVATSTVSKWLATPPKKVPSQANVDKLTAWWRGQLGDDAKPAPRDRPSQAAGAIRHTPTVSLAKLSEPISERLRKTARLRNVQPLTLAEQILDRHLPKLHELE